MSHTAYLHVSSMLIDLAVYPILTIKGDTTTQIRKFGSWERLNAKAHSGDFGCALG